MYEIFRKNHLQSGLHKRLANSITSKYNITYLQSNKIDDTIKKFLRSHFKKYENFQAIISAKILKPSNQSKKIRRQHTCPRAQLCKSNAFFFSKIKIKKNNFILED